MAPSGIELCRLKAASVRILAPCVCLERFVQAMSSQGDYDMPTIFAVYNAKDAKIANDYEAYAKEKKIPFARALPAIKSFEIYRIDGVLGPGVAVPQNSPTEPLYQFVQRSRSRVLRTSASPCRHQPYKRLSKSIAPYLIPAPCSRWDTGLSRGRKRI